MRRAIISILFGLVFCQNHEAGAEEPRTVNCANTLDMLMQSRDVSTLAHVGNRECKMLLSWLAIVANFPDLSPPIFELVLNGGSRWPLQKLVKRRLEAAMDERAWNDYATRYYSTTAPVSARGMVHASTLVFSSERKVQLRNMALKYYQLGLPIGKSYYKNFVAIFQNHEVQQLVASRFSNLARKRRFRTMEWEYSNLVDVISAEYKGYIEIFFSISTKNNYAFQTQLKEIVKHAVNDRRGFILSYVIERAYYYLEWKKYFGFLSSADLSLLTSQKATLVLRRLVTELMRDGHQERATSVLRLFAEKSKVSEGQVHFWFGWVYAISGKLSLAREELLLSTSGLSRDAVARSRFFLALIESKLGSAVAAKTNLKISADIHMNRFYSTISEVVLRERIPLLLSKKAAAAFTWQDFSDPNLRDYNFYLNVLSRAKVRGFRRYFVRHAGALINSKDEAFHLIRLLELKEVPVQHIVVLTNVLIRKYGRFLVEGYRVGSVLRYFEALGDQNDGLKMQRVALLKAIGRRQSGFNTKARSKYRAVGLMQLLPVTARYVARRNGLKYDEESLLEPSYNLKLANYLIGDYLEKHEGYIVPSLVEYVSGAGGARRVVSILKERQKLSILWNFLLIEGIVGYYARFFVKVVLLDYLVYRSLEAEGRISQKVLRFRMQ